MMEKLSRFTLLAVCVSVTGMASAQLQPIFSLDGPLTPTGPSPSLGTIPAGPDDMVNVPTGPPSAGPPLIFMPGMTLGIAAGGVGGPSDIDAFSMGRTLNDLMSGVYYFSVDRMTFGLPGTGAPPDVFSEAVAGEASSDIFVGLVGPIPPIAFPPGSVGPGIQQFDGDGIGSYVGMGLWEQPPTPDDIDAMDLAPQLATGPFVYFSLDRFAGAANNGVAPADVLSSMPGSGMFGMFASAGALGLDLLGGPGSDDVDALAVVDVNADGVFQAGTDIVLFSLRQGSATIGMMDLFFGAPISGADILIDPAAAQAYFGGPAGAFPGIFVPGEVLGLSTIRVGGAPDDLNALDVINWPLQGLQYPNPTYNSTLAKTQNNVITLVFNQSIAIAPGPPAPIVVHPLITSNPQVLGPDLSANFTYSLLTTVAVNDTLKCKETGPVLANQTWYRVLPTANLVDAASGISLPPGFGFPYDVCTLIGDANGDGLVMALDLGVIWAKNGQVTDDREDINGDGTVMALDLGVAWGQNGASTPPKP